MYRIDESFGIVYEWVLLVGDVLHNLRCALDHAWWQCAMGHLGRQPTDDEAGRIQFPIRRPGKGWHPANFAWIVDPAIIQIAERYQPQDTWDGHEFHPLGSLNLLSNDDKHRVIELAVFVPQEVSFSPLAAARYRDCELVERDGGVGVFRAAGPYPYAGKEIARLHVRATGPEPDLEFEVKITGQVTIRGDWDRLEVLDQMGATVAQILGEIDPAA